MTQNQLLRAIDGRRERLGISQAELARKAGVNIASLQGWINGDHTPGLELLLRLMDVLGMKLCYTIKERYNPCAVCALKKTCAKKCGTRLEYEENWMDECYQNSR